MIPIPVAAGVLYPLFGLLLNLIMAGPAMAMSPISVVTNSLRLKSFAPPANVEEIVHPRLRRRIADISYLLAIGLPALALGVASLLILKSSIGIMGGGQ